MKKPTNFESQLAIGAIKWFAVPVITIGLLYSCIALSYDRSRCSKLCI